MSRPTTTLAVWRRPAEVGGLPGSLDVVPRQEKRAAVIELVGLVLLGANMWWVYAAGAFAGGTPGPVALLFVACAAAYTLARMVGSSLPTAVPVALVAAAAVVAIATPDLLRMSPLSGPFGYGNAKGAFFAQAAIAALFVVFTSKGTLPRFLGTASAAWFAVVPFAAGSLTPAVLLILAFLIILAASTRRAAQAVVLAFAGLFVSVLAITLVLGTSYWNEGRASPLGRGLDATLTERRLVLWHEALVLIRLNPLVGVGPGRFGEVSPTARRVPDARWAHNEFLQHGAEAGIVGFVLLGLVFPWGFARLWTTAHGRTAAMGAAALTLLGVHASVDYVMHFPMVPIYAASLVGAGSAVPRRAVRSTR